MKIVFLRKSISIEGEPLGVMQLSALAKERGHQTYLLPAQNNLDNQINQIKPDIIALSVMSSEYPNMKPVIQRLKKQFSDIPVILGGPHATFAKNAINDLPVDALCVGEGENSFKEIIKRVESGSNFEGIPNIHTQASKSEIGPLIENLDELPFPDRELLYNSSLSFERFRVRSFMSSRGCIYKCNYCFVPGYNELYKGLGNIVRKRSPDHLIEEICEVTKKYTTEFIRFSDDIFIYGVDDWFEEFSRKYRKKVNLPFYCLLRSNSVRPELVKAMKEAGCHSVCMSLETANDELRRMVLKRKVTNEQYIKSFDLFNNAGIKIYTNSMVALPHATLQDELDTLDLNIRCKPACGLFSICVPYPGTDIFDYCVENKWVKKDLKFEEINQSTGEFSMLSSFSQKEKQIQKNISLLAPLTIRFPILKNLVVKRLIYWPNNIIFGFLHYFGKSYLFKKYIFPSKYSLFESILMLLVTFKAELDQIYPKKHKKSS